MFSKRVEQLTYDDVITFLNENRPEGTCLDYKRDMIEPEKIAKLCSAFANTNGGFIVFGVKEEDRRPVKPFVGGNLRGSPAQKIQQACRDRLDPPIEPIVGRVLYNRSDREKAFLVVAVPQSGKTPHALKETDQVYVKVQDHKDPMQPTLSLYQRLLNEREICVQERDAIYQEMLLKEQSIWPEAPSGQANAQGVPTGPYMYMSVDRAYPDGKNLCTPQEVAEHMDHYSVHVATPHFHDVNLPVGLPTELHVFERGAYSERSYDEVTLDVVMMFHCAGGVVARAWFPVFRADRGYFGNIDEETECVPGELVCAIIMGILRCAFRWFQAFGCYSALRVQVRLFPGKEPCRVSSRLPDGTRYLLHPSKPEPKFIGDVPWASGPECREIEQEMARQYISACGVSKSTEAEAFIAHCMGCVKTSV